MDIRPLVSHLSSSSTNLDSLALEDMRLDSASVSALAECMPSLKKFILQRNRLSERSLQAVIANLQHSPSLVHLDLSGNKLSKKALEKLVDSLLIKKISLERLVLQDCGIDYKGSSILARALERGIPGLQHLILNNNPFTWTPLTASKVATGAVQLVDALATQKTALLSLQVGESGHVSYRRYDSWGEPIQVPHLGNHRSRLKFMLRRNLQKHRDYRRSRLQASVVNIVGLLLDKLQHVSL